MSDFQEIINVVKDAVKFIFDSIIDIVCFSIFLTSFAIPWRILENVNIVSVICQQNDFGLRSFREVALVAFAFMIFDTIFFPLFLISHLSPLRWSTGKKLWKDYFDVMFSDALGLDIISSQAFEFRFGWLSVFFGGFCVDVICLPIGCLLVMLSIDWRIQALRHIAKNIDADDDSLNEFYTSLDFYIISMGAGGIVTTLMFMFSMPFMIVPTTWGGAYHGFRRIYMELPLLTVVADDESIAEMWREKVFGLYRDLISNLTLHAMVDIVAFPFVIVALLSPLRHRAMLEKIFPSLRPQEVVVDVNVTVNPSDSIPYRMPPNWQYTDHIRIDEFEFWYDFSIREEIFYLGCLGIGDLFAIPVIVCLMITRYRYPIAAKAMTSAQTSSSSLETYGTIYKQGFFLTVDLFLLSWIVPILFLSRDRWPVFYAAFKEENLKTNNALIYFIAIQELIQVILDVCVFPMTVLLILTWYRSKAVRHVYQNRSLWDEFGLYHTAVIINFSIVLHDILLLAPLLLLSCVDVFRIPVILSFMKEEWTLWFTVTRNDDHDRSVKEIQVHQPAVVIVDDVVIKPEVVLVDAHHQNEIPSGVDQDVYEDQVVRLTDNPPIAVDSSSCPHPPPPPLTNPYDEAYPIIIEMSSTRKKLWTQILLSIIDIIHMPVILILYATYWRSYELTRKIRVVSPDLSYVDKMKSYRITCKLWHVIQYQLLYLIRDCLFLIPFSIIFATLYRLPGVIATMLSKASGRPMLGEPVFDVLSCLCTFPPIGAPLLNMKVVRKRHINSSSPSSKPSPTSSISWDATKPVAFHVIGNDLWKFASFTYGNTIIAIAKSILPLKLKDKDSIGFSEFISSLSSEAGHDSNLSSDGIESVALDLWLKLDFGIAKSTSLLWKLKRLPMHVTLTMQFEAMQQDGSKAILCRISPTIQQILDLLKLSTDNLPSSAFNIPATLSAADLAAEDDNVVNSFYLIVGKAFVEILLDIIFLVLALCMILNPYRFISMIVTLFEHHAYLTTRKVDHVSHLINNMDDHLLAFRHISEPQVNKLVKTNISNKNRVSLAYYKEALDESLVIKENFHIKSYRKLAKRVDNTIGCVKGCEAMYSLITQRLELHHDLLEYWYLTCGSYMAIMVVDPSVNNTVMLSDDPMIVKGSLAISIFTEERYKVGTKLSRNTIAIRDAMMMINNHVRDEISHDMAKKKKSLLSSIGLFHRPISESRGLVAYAFLEMMKDIGFILLAMMIMMSGIRSIAIIRDLIEINSFNPTSYATRAIIKRHAIEIQRDLYYIIIICGYLSILIITVIGLPSFFMDMPYHMDSLPSFASCASKHVSRLMNSILEFLSFIFLWKTYKLIIKATILTFFVPGACLAEALPCTSFPANIRFIIGMIIWCAYLIGALLTVYSTHTSSSKSKALLIMSSAIFAMILASSLSVARRESYLHPRYASIRIPMLSWSHILALITGPFEVIQLSAIIMYYYWLSPSSSSPLVSDRYGHDNLSSYLLQWNKSYHSSHTEYHNSSSIACIATFVWMILISLPLTSNFESTVDRRQRKMQKFRESSLYEFMMVLYTRLFAIWLIATLMRPTSCVDGRLSTAYDVSCTPDDFWTTGVSLIMMIYFLFTSSIMHADDADMLNYASNIKILSYSVTFAPIYASWIRCGQVAMIAAAMATTWYAPTSASTNVALIFILVIAIIIAICPLFLPRADVCSFLAVIPIRSAGYVSIAWTAFICLLRYNRSSQSNEEAFLHTETTIYVGWIVLHIVAVAYAIHLETAAYRSWIAYLSNQGVFVAIDDMFEKLQAIFLDELSIYDTSSDATQHHHRLISSLEIMQHKLQTFHRLAKQSRSIPRLVHIILQLEEQIPFHRYSSGFLSRRKSWLDALQDVRKPQRNNYITTTHGQSHEIESQLSLIMMSMSVLGHAIHIDVSVRFNRHVLLILLSRRFPAEVCIMIMSYILDTNPLRQVLLTPLEPNNNMAGLSIAVGWQWNVPKPKLYGKPQRDLGDKLQSGTYHWLSFGVQVMQLKKEAIEDVNLTMVDSFDDERSIYIQETAAVTATDDNV